MVKIEQSTKPASLRQKWGALRQQIVGQDSVDLVARLTLIMLIVHTADDMWYDHISMTFAALCAFIHRPLQRNPWFWLGVALIRLVMTNYYDWATADNHECLVSYWCLAFGCCLLLDDSEEALAKNGRLLIGLAFLFATIWKVTSQEFLDGSACYFFLYNEPRFYELSRVLGDFTLNVGPFDRSVMPQLYQLKPTVELLEMPNLPRLAMMLTWWTIVIEAGIAVLFLLPPSLRISRWRHLMLVLFIVTTYIPVHVIGFAWILLIMAIAQCPSDSPKTRFAYVMLLPLTYAFAKGSLKHFVFYNLLS